MYAFVPDSLADGKLIIWFKKLAALRAANF
jgi:hypothetical protein